VKGRKRHLLVDTLGLVLVAVVHAADIPDREGARWVLKKAWAAWPRLRQIWADGGYAGSLVRWVQQHAGGSLEIVRRRGKSKGFHVLPYRWIVARTFAWLGKYRRLSKDYEFLPETSETMIYAAMIRLMVRRLARLHERSSPG
jgi:putative transposase